MFQFFQLWRREGKSGPVARAMASRELQKSRRARQRFLRPVVEQLESRWLLANILVTTHFDFVIANDVTSLREAVIQANVLGGHDTITFASSLANKPVMLDSLKDQITISDPLTIQGLGAGQTTVNAGNASRLFDITSAAGDVTFDRLTLTGGKTTANSVEGRGGAIRSDSAGQLTIQNSTISGNSTTGDGAFGGGIYAKGSLTVTNSTVSGNSTAGISAYGGGICALGSVTVTNSTISGNSTLRRNSDGGGIAAEGSVTVTNSTISGNFTNGDVAKGGGIRAFDAVTVTNSTITGNRVYGTGADGGGVINSDSMTIRNSIVAGNSDADGSHPDLRQFNNGPPIVQFSLIGNNTGADVPDGSGNLIGIDPLLGPLADNGGPTQTHRPLPGSPVIDAGSNGLAVDQDAQAELTTDQRGAAFARIVDGPDAGTTATVDMGAFELAAVPFALVVTTADDELDGTQNAADLSLREAIALANGGLGADTITFAAALAGQPILLTLGQMTISDTVTIQGLGATQSIVNGQLNSRLFDITDTAGDVTFDGLTLTGGKTTFERESGGAVRSFSAGQLTVQNSTVSGNSTTWDFSGGGGIFASGSVAVTNSTISGNFTTEVGGHGGGIFTAGSVTVTNSTISGNSTAGGGAFGGGIFASISVTVTNSTISGNFTTRRNGEGGGIWAGGSVMVTNSTIFGNSTAGESSGGGGISGVGAVTVTDSTITGNSTTGPSAAGGGIRASNSVTVTNSTISDNATTGGDAYGGGIYAKGPLTVTNSNISGNSTAGGAARGGGILANGSATITNSTISGNSTAQIFAHGGGILANGSATITNSTISGNSTTGDGASGGGIFAAGSLTVTNSTISGNSTTGDATLGSYIEASGGGINAFGSVTVTNSTITGNSVAGTSADGGGVFASSGPVTIHNSIVAGNLDTKDGSHPDLRLPPTGTPTVQFSLIGNKTGTVLAEANPGPDASGNKIGGPVSGVLNPQIGPLANNGGPTKTHALSANSPAIDAGDPGFAAPPTTDQRGAPFVRVADGPDAGATARLDMGAFEFQPLSIPSTLVVDTAIDESDGNYAAGDLSLRDAVALANASSGPHTITFAPALAGRPIGLTLGQMSITDPLTLRGLGAGQTTVRGSTDPQHYSRLFDITSTAGAVTFDGLTLTGGKTTANFEIGGALRSPGSNVQVNIQNSTISGNSTIGSSGAGGGIAASGPLTVTNSTISGNFTMGSFANGGGIAASGPLTVTNSTISGNSTNGSQASGGGMSAFGVVTINNSTLSGNFTIGNNSHGGGIYANGSLTVTNSTITGNSVAGSPAYGGGVFGASFFSYDGGFITEVTIRNSIVAGNRDIQDGSHPDVVPGGVPLTVRYSLIGDNTGTGLTPVPVGTPDPSGNGNKIGGGTDPTRINPRLGPLANNGGRTQTHALCTGAGAPVASCIVASPALNAGSNDLIPPDTFDLDGDGDTAEPLPFDQRGPPFNRVSATTVDMGALESQPGFPWHNFAMPFDVRGGSSIQPDNFVDAGDALAIINYVNTMGADEVPDDAVAGQPFGFLDTNMDNSVAADDALSVINAINSGLGGEGEAGEESGVRGQGSEGTGDRGQGTGIGAEELIALLAEDVGEFGWRRAA